MLWPLLRQSAEDAITDLPSLRNAAEKVAANILQGGHAQHKAGGHEKFWQYREYQQSDRPQDIDWRQSAKTDHIYVREKERQNPQTAFIWCNRGKSMRFKSTHAKRSKLEAAQILSLAMALVFERADEQIGFLGGGRAGRSELALSKIGQTLLEPSEETLPDGKATSHSQLVLCGDFLTPIKAFPQKRESLPYLSTDPHLRGDAEEALEDYLKRFASQGSKGVILQVLDPAEITLPYSGHVVFEGLDEAQHKIDNVASIRGEYQMRMERHIRAIKKLCADFGWIYALHKTDKPLDITLMKVWEELGRVA